MPLVPLKQVLDEAIKSDYGVGAYNVNNMEQIQGIMRAASETQSPVIIQASRGALKYTNMAYIKLRIIPVSPSCCILTMETALRPASRP